MVPCACVPGPSSVGAPRSTNSRHCGPPLSPIRANRILTNYSDVQHESGVRYQSVGGHDRFERRTRHGGPLDDSDFGRPRSPHVHAAGHSTQPCRQITPTPPVATPTGSRWFRGRRAVQSAARTRSDSSPCVDRTAAASAALFSYTPETCHWSVHSSQSSSSVRGCAPDRSDAGSSPECADRIRPVPERTRRKNTSSAPRKTRPPATANATS